MLKIERKFTKIGQKPEDTLKWEHSDEEIKDYRTGKLIFSLKNGEYPKDMSPTARSIAASKYFRRAGVPQKDGTLGGETSFKQAATRLVKCWSDWGAKYDYFATKEDQQAFEDEVLYMLYHQMASPNSPQWFNTGLQNSYGINGPSQGHYFVDSKTGQLQKSEDAYTRPQPHACFAAGTLVTTINGMMPIESILVGDLVLTHTGTFKKVLDTSIMTSDHLNTIKLEGSSKTLDIKVTDTHPVYTLRDGKPQWVPVNNLSRGDLVADMSLNVSIQAPIKIYYNEFIPALESTYALQEAGVGYTNTRRIQGSGTREFTRGFDEPSDGLEITPDAMYILGYYLGDGYCRNEEIEVSFGEKDPALYSDFKKKVEEITGYKVNLEIKEGTGAYLQFAKRRGLYYFIENHFGRTSKDKKVPNWVLSTSKECKEAFIAGLIDSDGCVADGGKRVFISTSSEALIPAITAILSDLGYSYSLYMKTGIAWNIKGKTGKSNKRHWTININKRPNSILSRIPSRKIDNINLVRTSDSTIKDQGRVWRKIRYISKQDITCKVYNLQVEEDESYVANGIVVHNCFIQSIKDDLVGNGGIMDLWTREARLFKYGSGTGTNFSNLRGLGEPLSGGGTSSGLLSFLKIGDAAAGSIKSGGTTRRAAKMVCLDLDHPEIESFISWKMREEQKAKMLIAAGLDPDFNGEAYQTVAGQNSNNSVRMPHEFMKALERDQKWSLYYRTELAKAKKENRPAVPHKQIPATQLMQKIAEAAWNCADPGVQFHGTINDWNTCSNDGEILASNPCSEYMFLDDTACNLASLNFDKFYSNKTKALDVEAIIHASRLWTIILDISVSMAQLPSEEIAIGTHNYRTLGLGYANLGSVLMKMAIPYDSDKARAVSSALTAIVCGESARTSAEMASCLGTFPKYDENKDSVNRVMRNHRRAVYDAPTTQYENLTVLPVAVDQNLAPEYLLKPAKRIWDDVVDLGEKFGFRNAQTTCIAPTGTIGLLMDCDTTGIEPDFALVKFKKLAGGGHYKIVNQSVEPALETLGYSHDQRKEILTYVLGTNALPESGHMSDEYLRNKDITEKHIKQIKDGLEGSLDLNMLLSMVLGPEKTDKIKTEIGQEQFQRISYKLCGHQTTEGAPHLKEEHYPVFDCANNCGPLSTRFIPYEAHLKMMAAAQPFISGAISKTVNMPSDATIEDVKHVYELGYKLGLKAVALYRDGSKGSQPLNSGKTEEKENTKVEIREIMIPVPTDSRLKLSRRRRGFTYELKLGGQKIYIRTGETEDAQLAEVFISMFREGSDVRTLFDCLAIVISKALQAGVALEEIIESFQGIKMGISGVVEGHDYIKMASSPVDLLVRVLGMEYLNNFELGTIKEQNGTVLGPPAPQSYQTIHGMTSSPKSKTKTEVYESVNNKVEVAVLTQHEKKKKSIKTRAVSQAEPCTKCGSIMTPNGACLKCENCGATTGCSG
mgnify:CR=1 FL=1